MQFYAYLWLRENGTPYYVGKGHGNRAFIRQNHRVRRPIQRDRIIIFLRSSEADAFATEKELIANWGRKNLGTGCLRNFTDGGEGMAGYRMTAETKAKISAAKQHLSPKTRAKLSIARRQHGMTPETCAKISAAQIGRVFTADHIEKLRQASTGRKHSAAAIVKMSAAKRGVKFTVEHRARISASRLGKKPSLETRLKMSRTRCGKQQTPEHRAHSRAARNAYLDREFLKTVAW